MRKQMPVMPVRYGRLSPRWEESGAHGRELVHRCGEVGGGSKKAYETAADQDREIRRGEGGCPPNFFFLPFGPLPWIRHCQTPKSLNTLLEYERSLDKFRLTWINLVKFFHIHEQLVHRGFTGISLIRA